MIKNNKKYYSIIKMGIMESLNFRASFFLTCFGNLIYFIVILFLWKAIYNSNGLEKIKGMSVDDTIIYLVLATAIYRFLDCFLVSNMDADIKSGKIALDIIRPVNYPIFCFCKALGSIITTFAITFLPIFCLILFYIDKKISIINCILFFASLVLSIMLSFLVDFFAATICFYTYSGWGINILKQLVIQLFSGVIIPISFFSDDLLKIIKLLPFQAIYNIPLNNLLNDNCNYYKNFICQILWIFFLIAIDYAFWKKSIKNVSVNGG